MKLSGHINTIFGKPGTPELFPSLSELGQGCQNNLQLLELVYEYETIKLGKCRLLWLACCSPFCKSRGPAVTHWVWGLFMCEGKAFSDFILSELGSVRAICLFTFLPNVPTLQSERICQSTQRDEAQEGSTCLTGTRLWVQYKEAAPPKHAKKVLFMSLAISQCSRNWEWQLLLSLSGRAECNTDSYNDYWKMSLGPALCPSRSYVWRLTVWGILLFPPFNPYFSVCLLSCAWGEQNWGWRSLPTGFWVFPWNEASACPGLLICGETWRLC